MRGQGEGEGHTNSRRRNWKGRGDKGEIERKGVRVNAQVVFFQSVELCEEQDLLRMCQIFQHVHVWKLV